VARNKAATKREKKELRRKKRAEEREKARKEREQRERRERYIKYAALTVIFIFAGFYLLGRDTGARGSPRITIEPLEYDFGDVSVSTGAVVKTVMKIKNEGGSDLVLNDMETSCGCTSAAVEKDGKEGPVFGMRMHGNPTGWSVTLKPGETALLNVYYDPRVHPDLRGAVTRSIAIYSNDPKAPVKEVRIHVNQVD